MTAHDVYLEATKRGLRLEPRGDKLAVMPKGACSPDFADVLRQHKAELLDWLSRPPCPGWQAIPPDGLPLNSVTPRPEPADRERVTGYLWRQGGHRPGPLTAWLLRRENAYFEGPGVKWDCAIISYAAARDAACWQLHRSEQQLFDFLVGVEDNVTAHRGKKSAKNVQ